MPTSGRTLTVNCTSDASAKTSFDSSDSLTEEEHGKTTTDENCAKKSFALGANDGFPVRTDLELGKCAATRHECGVSLVPSPHRSRLLFALLYLGEGAPIGFIWWALPTWLRGQGLPVEQITGLTGLLVLPWVGKFLWAPLIDRISDTRRGLRGCIVGAQLLMGATLVPLLWLDVAQHFPLVRWLLILHAFAAATQDVAVDALALRIVPVGDRGRLNGGMQAGMLVGRSAFGGGALILAAHLGWPVLIAGLVACIWLSTTAVLLVRTPDVRTSEPARQLPREKLRVILRRRSVWLGLLFAVTAGAAFEAAGVLCGPMLVDHGFSQSTVGWLFGVPVVGATIVGGLVGGVWADRFGRTRVVAYGVIGFTTMVLALAGLSLSAITTPALFFAILTGLYFCIGLFTATSYALFMGLSQPPLAATQFSAFMAATNGCEAWASWIGGWIAGRWNYGMAFGALSVVSLLALVLLKPLTAAASKSKT